MNISIRRTDEGGNRLSCATFASVPPMRARKTHRKFCLNKWKAPFRISTSSDGPIERYFRMELSNYTRRHSALPATPQQILPSSEENTTSKRYPLDGKGDDPT